MNRSATDKESLLSEIRRLRDRLEETEEILDAIRYGRVDALVVPGEERDRIYTLEGADQSYRVMIETMNEGAVVLSEEGTVLYCNRRFAEMLRLPLQTIIGGSMEDLVDSADRYRFEELKKRAFQSGANKAEMRFLAGDRDKIPVLVSMRNLDLKESNTAYMVVTDLTELKMTENMLKAYAEELQRKNSELNRRAEQLSRLSSELTMAEQRERRRLAKILHDHLQQVLVCARFNLEVLDDGRLDEQDWQTVENTIALLRESLNISRSLSVELSPPVLYEGGLIRAIEWLVRWMKEKHGMTVSFVERDARGFPMRDDMKTLLFSAIRELLFNVIKHADTLTAQVNVSRPDGQHIQIVVSDPGAGFDPVRCWNASNDFASGFGLISIRERLHMMGGKCQVESSPGGGTSVTLIAPVPVEVLSGKAAKGETKQKPTADIREQDLAASPDPEQAEPVIRVVLADDHDMMRQGLSMLLSSCSDIEVAGEAPDGEAAVQLARDIKPDVFLMDISMPKMNGIEATRIIHSENPYIRIIGLSMFDADDQADAIKKAGAVAYLKKSGNKNELLQTIRNVAIEYKNLRRSAASC